VNADELDAAREAVSATKTWRDQMRADWGTSFREPEEVLDEAVGELLAERDHWRFLARREAAERDRLRTAIVAVHNELVGALAANASSDIVESVRRLRAERDRLRAVVDAALSGLSLMAVEAKCHDDVLISADLYAALSRQLDATPTEEDT
jgi:hypothetical protein